MDPAKNKAYSRISNNNLLIAEPPARLNSTALIYELREKFSQTIAALAQAKASSFDLTSALSVQYSNSFQDIESYNVVGKIEGGDAQLKTNM